MLLAEALYLNPWNEQALSQLSLLVGQSDLVLLIADTIQESGNLWKASFLRYRYLYYHFSGSVKNTPSSAELPAIQKSARSFVEEGKKLLSFPEMEENKDLLLDVLLRVATAYAILENKIMVNEMINRAIAKNPVQKLDYEDKRGELLHLAEGELHRLVVIKDLQNAIDEENAYNALRSAGRGIRKELDKELDAPYSPFKRD